MSEQIRIEGDKACVAVLNRVLNADKGELTMRVALQVQEAARERLLRTQRDPDGNPYPGVRPTTPEQSDSRLGVETMAMANSIKARRLGRDDSEVEVSSNQASFFEEGTSKMARRAFLGPGADDDRRISDAIADFYEELIDDG